LRHERALTALAAGVSAFELARIMGTSAQMIERSYGTLIEDAGARIASRLDAFDAEQERAAEDVRPLQGQRRPRHQRLGYADSPC
jgi:hypothetical protein